MNSAFLAALKLLYSSEPPLIDPADCWAYGYDNSKRQRTPIAVVFPNNHQRVVDTIKLCRQHAIALVARGSGTGTTGATVPPEQAIVMSTERMRKIVKVDPDNRAMVVEPGITNQQVQIAAAEHGFFWPPDPTSAAICTVGGNLAYNSAGPKAVKYGTPRENTLGLQCVTGAGDTLTTGSYTTKSVVGYDLTRLIIGSEGTLAVITQATLKLTPLPEAKTTLQATYQSVQAAARAVSAIMSQSITPSALEFMDGEAIALVRDKMRYTLTEDAKALLLIEVDGDRDSLTKLGQTVAKAAQVDGVIEVIIAHDEEHVKTLWEARKALSPALRKISPKKINEDVVVPVTELPALIDGLSALSSRHQIPIVNFGHAGNGNIHVNLLIQPEQREQAEQCLAEVFALVMSLNGSLSGEHGIGLEKQNYINLELDSVALDLMKKIKRQFDPDNILNPDKVFPISVSD
jgi:D-lactate dehydrogenase